MTAVLWLRRDLRLTDHPALASAAEDGPVVPVFVRDPTLPAGSAPQRRLEASLAALREATDGALVVRRGSPPDLIDEVAAQVGADRVHVTATITPDGRRDEAVVAERLGLRGVGLVRSGTAYAGPPGRLHSRARTPFQVFTPFARAWRDHGAPPPRPVPPVRWRHGPPGDALMEVGAPEAARSGEALARHQRARGRS